LKKTINGADYKTMIVNAAVIVEKNKQALNDLNVFPVPDGDTGTNMSLTINYSLSGIAPLDTDHLDKVADKTAAFLLRGAHGNSGVITSLLFGGIARVFKEHASADVHLFATALKSGVDKAYSAVNKPAEGTILTVARKSAERAMHEATQNDDIEHMLVAVLETAYAALELTPTQNPVLAKAGVVDAGAKGFCYILEGMLLAVRGTTLTPNSTELEEITSKNIFSAFNSEDITFGYCTEFIVERTGDRSDPVGLRAFLESRGDSLVVVDDGEIIKVHVHTNNPGLALEEGLKYGGLTAIKIENMREQHTAKLDLSANESSKIAEPEKKYGFVSVAAGEGILQVFFDLGVDNMVEGGQTMNPSTEDILNSINRTPADVVFVLPNNKNIILAAEQTVELTDKKVIVIPTRTIPEGISALLAFDPDLSVEENAAAMAETATNVRTAHVTYAARDSVFDGIDIKQGDYLALACGSLGYTGSDLRDVCSELAAKLDLENAYLVTVFSGADATDADDQTLLEALNEKTGEAAEISLIKGGQPVFYYIIGVE